MAYTKEMNKLWWFGLLSILVFVGGCSEFENLSYDLQRKPAGKVAIVVDLVDQHAYLSKGGQAVLIAPVSTGREGYDTPAGNYQVIQKDIDHRSSIYGAYVRDGMIVQENVDVRKDVRPPAATFVGASMPYFLRIIGGVGLHAGYLPGYPASHGCIRMPESKAKRFFEAANVGTPVTIKR